MYVIFNRIKVREDCLDKFITGVRLYARNSSAEPGCVRYEVLQDVADPQTVCLYEVFRDEAAFRQHLTYDYYKEWMDNSKDWLHSEDHIRHVLDYVFGPDDDLPSQ